MSCRMSSKINSLCIFWYLGVFFSLLYCFFVNDLNNLELDAVSLSIQMECRMLESARVSNVEMSVEPLNLGAICKHEGMIDLEPTHQQWYVQLNVLLNRFIRCKHTPEWMHFLSCTFDLNWFILLNKYIYHVCTTMYAYLHIHIKALGFSFGYFDRLYWRN